MNQYYHFSNISFELKEYMAKKGNPYFGDYEKLFEKYKPIEVNSRLNSFYLVKKAHINFGEQFGENKYLIEADDVTTCYLFWNSALQSYCIKENLVKGFKHDYGYLLEKPNKKQQQIIKEIVENYFYGKKPTANDYKKYELEKDSETVVVEYLSSKIKVVKKF